MFDSKSIKKHSKLSSFSVCVRYRDKLKQNSQEFSKTTLFKLQIPVFRCLYVDRYLYVATCVAKLPFLLISSLLDSSLKLFFKILDSERSSLMTHME